MNNEIEVLLVSKAISELEYKLLLIDEEKLKMQREIGVLKEMLEKYRRKDNESNK